MRDLQLTGDELLMWTIETFNAFYPQTFAQKYFIPLMGLFPLLLSIATFVYDYYSGFATDGFFFLSAFFTFLLYVRNHGFGRVVKKREDVVWLFSSTENNCE